MTDFVHNTVLFQFEDLAQKNIFQAAMKEDEVKFSFNKIIPMPDDIKVNDDDNWFNVVRPWCINNWDVKYGPHSLEPDSPSYVNIESEGEKHIIYHFFTPWGFPVKIAEKLRMDFSHLFLSMLWYGEGSHCGEEFEVYL